LGRIDSEGRLEYLGRSDSSLKLHGNWIDAPEIEAGLIRITGVREAVVVVRENKSSQPELVAYVVVENGTALTMDTLRRALIREQGNIAVPSRFVAIEALPLDANGKVKRQMLPEPDWSRPNAGTAFVSPTTALELVLTRIWCQVLKLEQVGINDDFGELGGDSLQATEIAIQIEQQLQQKLPPSVLLEAPCISELARRLARPNAEDGSLVAIQPKGTRPPIFCMHDHYGDPIGYGPLARLLGSDQPLFGLRMQGLNDENARHGCIEDMAAHYVSEIRRIQPRGPYRLVGDCVGGVIAFEMAQQLTAAGEEIALLALLDTGWRDPRLRTKWRKHLGQMSGKTLGGKIIHLGQLAGRILQRLSARILTTTSSRGGLRQTDADLLPKAAIEYMVFLERSYRPKRYCGKATVIIVGPPRNHLAGLKMKRCDVRVVQLPAAGSDDTHVMHPRRSEDLAQTLQKLLLEADACRLQPRPS
jgi:acyl carrier protein